jgi:transporter family protein
MSWIVLGILSAVFASAVAILGKIGLQGIDNTLATTIRSIVMAGFLFTLTLMSGKFSYLSTLNSKALLFIVASGVAGALSWLAMFAALKIGPATGVVALDRLSIIFVLIFAALFLSESLTIKTALGGLLILIGSIILVWK